MMPPISTTMATWMGRIWDCCLARGRNQGPGGKIRSLNQVLTEKGCIASWRCSPLHLKPVVGGPAAIPPLLEKQPIENSLSSVSGEFSTDIFASFLCFRANPAKIAWQPRHRPSQHPVLFNNDSSAAPVRRVTQVSMTPVSGTPAVDFEPEMARSVRCLQGYLNDAYLALEFNSLPSLEVSRRLGVDKSLAWKMGRFLAAADPFEAAKHLPGQAGIQKFVGAISAHGVPQPLIASIEKAAEGVSQTGRAHSKDRTSLRAMLANLCRIGRQLRVRKNSAEWRFRPIRLFGASLRVFVPRRP